MRRLFKVILSIIFIFMLCGCGGGGASSSNESSSKGATIRIMPLGDSITYDDAHAYYDASGNDIMPAGKRTAYRSYLAWDLDDAGISYDFVGSQRAGYDVEPPFDPDNEGHPSWTSTDISNKVYDFLVANPADIILLHIGTNDHSTSISGVMKIISEIKRYEAASGLKIKIFVALIINRKFHDGTIDGFNSNLQEYLSSLNDPNIITVDMSSILDSSVDYRENTHPNKSGYKKMADKWFSTLTDYL